MKAKGILTVVLLLFVVAAVVALVVRNGGGAAGPGEAAAAPANVAEPASSAPQHQVVATYFHNTVRCPSCIKIEGWSRSAIEGTFADELKEGSLVYRMVNVDDKENAHYVQDYGLYTKHLVLSERVKGKEARWVDLPRVWDLLGDQDKFSEYVTSNVSAYLAGEVAPAETERDAAAAEQPK